MNKKYFTFLTISVLAVSLGTSAYAFYGSSSQSQTDIISTISERFNLNSADVQKVFEEQRLEHQAEMQERFTDYIEKAVSDGKLTQEQADKIITKHAEVKAQRDVLQGKTKEEIKSAMKNQRDALQQWATNNNIPTQYLMFGGLGGKGLGMFGHGQGGGNCLNK